MDFSAATATFGCEPTPWDAVLAATLRSHGWTNAAKLGANAAAAPYSGHLAEAGPVDGLRGAPRPQVASLADGAAARHVRRSRRRPLAPATRRARRRSVTPVRVTVSDRRPWVLVNMAMSADGKTDTFERRGARISSGADDARVQRLRAESDALMVGGRTLLAEDPRLTVRSEELMAGRRARGRGPQPMKAAVVSVLPDGPVDEVGLGRFLGSGGGRVVVFTTAWSTSSAVARLRDRGAEVVLLGRDRVDLAAALEWLAKAGVSRLLVEGGGTLVAALLADGLVDELSLYVAPLIIGGATSPTPVAGPGIRRAESIELDLAEARSDGDGGVVLRYLVKHSPSAQPRGGAPEPIPESPS
jgi:2,5-diamino-6-(ribosylamino)-4(3H)-pyrimidinone 5'-phosphate reductase